MTIAVPARVQRAGGGAMPQMGGASKTQDSSEARVGAMSKIFSSLLSVVAKFCQIGPYLDFGIRLVT